MQPCSSLLLLKYDSNEETMLPQIERKSVFLFDLDVPLKQVPTNRINDFLRTGHMDLHVSLNPGSIMFSPKVFCKIASYEHKSWDKYDFKV